MLPPFALPGQPTAAAGGMPWIHIDDLVELMLFAAREERVTSPLNGVAPTPVTNREFTKTLGRVLGRPTFLPPVPRFVLRTMLGEFADVLLDSQRVYPRAAEAAGFAFKYRELEPALRDVLKK
jgi:NAD dependent epimerase/dehydratase family enzyme